MPRPIPSKPPVYPRNGFDYARVRLGPGEYTERPLGPAGSPEAQEAYDRLVAELQSAGPAALVRRPDVTVVEVIVAYLEWAQGYYDHRQYARLQTALRPVRELYGRTPAREFGPVALEACRGKYVEQQYARAYCNQLVNCVRGCFRWLVSKELVPSTVPERLASLLPLRKGKTPAPERDRVPPVDLSVVEATLSHLDPVLSAMVQLLGLTGMRPGEVCVLRPQDLVRPWRTLHGLDLWLYEVPDHKTDWHEIRRGIPLVPRAQALLQPYLDRPSDRPCFSPREVREKWCQARGRSTHTGKSRRPGLHYTTQSFDRAIRKAAKRAGVPHWSPGQLRHTVAERIRAEYGDEAASAVLGHTVPGTLNFYAELVGRAAEVLARIG